MTVRTKTVKAKWSMPDVGIIIAWLAMLILAINAGDERTVALMVASVGVVPLVNFLKHRLKLEDTKALILAFVCSVLVSILALVVVGEMPFPALPPIDDLPAFVEALYKYITTTWLLVFAVAQFVYEAIKDKIDLVGTVRRVMGKT